MARVAIRREDKNEWEARAPLTPSDVAALVADGVDFAVQPSRRRVYDDLEYERAGADHIQDLQIWSPARAPVSRRISRTARSSSA